MLCNISISLLSCHFVSFSLVYTNITYHYDRTIILIYTTAVIFVCACSFVEIPVWAATGTGRHKLASLTKAYFISRMLNSSLYPIFDHSLESSYQDIGFGEEIMQAVSIEVNLTRLILSSYSRYFFFRSIWLLFSRGYNACLSSFLDLKRRIYCADNGYFDYFMLPHC